MYVRSMNTTKKHNPPLKHTYIYMAWQSLYLAKVRYVTRYTPPQSRRRRRLQQGISTARCIFSRRPLRTPHSIQSVYVRSRMIHINELNPLRPSVFHRFPLVHVQLRPGGHDTLPAKPIDVSAFSYSKRTAHQSPLSFLKRGTGNGGTVIPFGSGEESSSGGATKGGGGTRASARAAALKKTKLRDFQVFWCGDKIARVSRP